VYAQFTSVRSGADVVKGYWESLPNRYSAL